jgi:hypothetical protein
MLFRCPLLINLRVCRQSKGAIVRLREQQDAAWREKEQDGEKREGESKRQSKGTLAALSLSFPC